VREDLLVIWRDWSEQKRAQVVNGVATALLGSYAVATWFHGDRRWAAIACGLMLVNVVGGLRMALKARRNESKAD